MNEKSYQNTGFRSAHTIGPLLLGKPGDALMKYS